MQTVMQTVPRESRPRSVRYRAVTGDLAGAGLFARACLPRSRSAVVVCDANTHFHAHEIETSLRNAGFLAASVEVPAGERSKSLTELSHLYDSLYEVVPTGRRA